MTRFSRRRFTTCILGIWLTTASIGASAGKVADPMRPAEVEVIASFVNSLADLLERKDARPKPIVALNRTRSISSDYFVDENLANRLRKNLPEASGEVIAAFEKLQNESAEVKIPDRLIRHEFKIVVISRTQLDKIFSNQPIKEWPSFYKAFPGSSGFFSVSRVGFDAAGNQALFYVEHVCGGLCGTGTMVLMKFDWGSWRVAKTVQLWIS
jgi:hypothetical protein